MVFQDFHVPLASRDVLKKSPNAAWRSGGVLIRALVGRVSGSQPFNVFKHSDHI